MKKINPWQANNFTGSELQHEYIPTSWEEVTDFDDEGFGWVRTDNGWGFVNREGYLVIADEYDLIFFPHFRHGLCKAKKNGKCGVIDRSNNPVIRFIYDDLYGNLLEENPIFSVCFNSKWGIIDSKENPVVPFEYEDITGFNSDFITARLNGKYGVIDYQQNIIIDFTWAHLEILGDNFSAGKTVDIWFDKKKLEECDVIYSRYFKHFTEEYQKIVFGVIDINQKVIYPFVSDSVIREFNPANGRAKISLNHWEHEETDIDDLCFVADHDGRKIPFDPPLGKDGSIEDFSNKCNELIWGEEI